MIHEFNNPIPVVTPMGDGYAWYVRDSGMHENDLYTVVLKKGGRIIHCTSKQIRISANSTFDITKDETI
ncbi:MAG: hypothetical protein ACK5DE_02560 [Bacteroidota bacterium]